MKVVSTHSASSLPFWNERVDTIRHPGLHTDGFPAALFPRTLIAGLRLWWTSRKYDAIVATPSFATAICGLLRLLPGLWRPRLLVIENYHNYHENPFVRLLKRLQMKLVLSRNAKAVVYSRVERGRFSRYFGIRPDRFVYVPYHTTLYAHRDIIDEQSENENYIFAGGDSLRDYATLFAAIEGTGERLIVSVRDQNILRDIRIPANVKVTTTDHRGFLRLMQRAKINVVPLAGGMLRSAGQQTYLNAMAMGTVTIVTDVESANDYINNWTDGILVEAGNSAALRDAIIRVSRSPELASRIRREARRKTRFHDTEVILLGYLEMLANNELWNHDVAEFIPAVPAETPATKTA